MQKLSRLWFTIGRFWQNMMVGLLIALAVHVFHDAAFLKGPQDKAIDLMIRMNAGLPRLTASGMGQKPQNFTFLEIDEQSFRNWGEPYHVPRDKLLSLIRFAAEGGARLVIVDIDLGKQGINKDHDAALKNWATDYGKNGPPLIFVRTLKSPLPQKSDPVSRFGKHILDPLSSPRILFAHPVFQKDGTDKIGRAHV